MSGFTKTKEQIAALSPDKRERATALLKKLEFQNAELEKLQKAIRKNGWVEEYQNGANQRGLKKSSEADMYNTLIKNFNATMKALNDMLPDDSGDGMDELELFLHNSGGDRICRA